MLSFLASKYESLADSNPLIIIPHHQIFSVIWCIWNITPQRRALTISLHELGSKFAHTCELFFSYLHIASIYMTYINGWLFFLASRRNHKLVNWRYWSKFISAYLKVTKNVTNLGSIFEHDWLCKIIMSNIVFHLVCSLFSWIKLCTFGSLNFSFLRRM